MTLVSILFGFTFFDSSLFLLRRLRCVHQSMQEYLTGESREKTGERQN